MEINNKILGTFYIFIGSILCLFFIGPFLIRMAGTIFSIVLINYGLKLLGKPSIKILFYQSISSLKSHLFKKSQ